MAKEEITETNERDLINMIDDARSSDDEMRDRLALDAPLPEKSDNGTSRSAPPEPSDAGLDETDEVNDEIDAPTEESDSEQADGLDPALIDRALDAGLSREQAMNMDPTALSTIIDVLDRQISDIGRRRDEKDGKGPEAPDSVRALREFKVKAERKRRRSSDEDEWSSSDDTERDAPSPPDWIDQFGDMHSATVDAFDQLQSRVHQLEAEINGYRQSDQQNRFDSWIDSQGDSIKEVLGKGPSDSLQGHGAFARNREKIRDEVEALRIGYQRLEKPMPPDNELWSRAMRMLFPKQFQTEARKDLEQKVKTQRKAAVSRPTRRRSVEGHISEREEMIRAMTEARGNK